MSFRGLMDKHNSRVTVRTHVLVTTDVLGFLLVPIFQFLEKTSLPHPLALPACLHQGSGGGAPLPGALC